MHVLHDDLNVHDLDVANGDVIHNESNIPESQIMMPIEQHEFDDAAPQFDPSEESQSVGREEEHMTNSDAQQSLVSSSNDEVAQHEQSNDIMQIQQEEMNESIDLKPDFPAVVTNAEDVAALDNLFEYDNIVNEPNVVHDVTNTQPENTVPPVKTTVKFGDDLEYTFSSNNDFHPFGSNGGYLIKAHDQLSEDIPFKPNVIFLRCFFFSNTIFVMLFY